MSDEPSGPVFREVTETYYIPVCPQCGERLMDNDRCYFCRWRSPDYVPPATEKKWTPNPYLKAERWAVSGGRCFYCGQFIGNRSHRGLDHLIPQSRGGTHDPENLLPCCRSCNSGKHRKTLEEYRTWLREKRYFLSELQLAWVRELGCPISNDLAPEIVFAFEREGWV